MVRKLKLHEKKLLKKTDFMQWEIDQHGKQTEQMRKYNITKREHYSLYNKLAAEVRSIAEKLKELPPNEPFRVRSIRRMLSKLYAVGIIPTSDTAERLGKVSAACFARRRLPVVMKRIGMVDSIRGASDFEGQGKAYVSIGAELSPGKIDTFALPCPLVAPVTECEQALTSLDKHYSVEQGHVRIGPKLVTDPAFVVTRNQEDAITWTNASKIKQHVLDYNNARDDFDLA